jgi:hypothetical protein
MKSQTTTVAAINAVPSTEREREREGEREHTQKL